MTVYLLLKIFAMVLLLSPLLLIALAAICMFLPGVANLLSTLFWELLGSMDIFSLASQVVQTAVKEGSFSGENYSLWIITLLIRAVPEALILGCCVYLTKITHMRFSRKFTPIYSRPLWLLTVGGVILGVVVCNLLQNLVPQMELAISLVVYLACLILGLRLMFRSVTPGRTYKNRKWGFFGNLLLEIFCNMVNAVSGVLIVTCVLEGPKFVQSGGSFRVWITWIGASVAVMYAMHLMTNLLKPKEY